MFSVSGLDSCDLMASLGRRIQPCDTVKQQNPLDTVEPLLRVVSYSSLRLNAGEVPTNPRMGYKSPFVVPDEVQAGTHPMMRDDSILSLPSAESTGFVHISLKSNVR